METKPTKISDIKRVWHLMDANDQILGRFAVDVARKLIGKEKPYFIPYLDCGDYVVVINAKEIKVTGRKETEKVYYRHSNYPGGLKSETLEKLRQRNPKEIIRHAVLGMLPKNKLRALRLKRLFIFPGQEHPYASKFK